MFSVSDTAGVCKLKHNNASNKMKFAGKSYILLSLGLITTKTTICIVGIVLASSTL
jgi:hypothetical protein